MCTWGGAMSAELHPPAGTLADYAAGALDEVGTERIREHLAECSHCARVVLDLTAPGIPEERRDPDPELAAAWRSHLEHRARDEDRDGVPDGARDDRWRRAGPALAASVLVALALLAGLYAGRFLPGHEGREMRSGELRQPVLAVPGLELLPEGSLRTGAPEPRIAPPREAALLTLTLVLLDPAELPPSGRYELEVYRTPGDTGVDEPVWRGDGRMSEERDLRTDTLTVVVPRDFLAPGRYRLVLRALLRETGTSGGSDGGAGVLATYRFRLSSPGGTDARSPRGAGTR